MDGGRLLTDAQQFRLDVVEALAAIDTEIDALQRAVEEGQVVTSARWKELRANSRQRIGRFRDYHSQRVGLL
jgi:hypothetical protein